ncbi:uncharacterized protein RCC_05310 [Ramularia collo-cygni]|uniref:Uncharacterized protein n=1 Tax=Ramularia collo-cygni TaxID=112498 RepID=A0A2D3VCU0_9PEZI|nr:uncharacterized protein RCC_05310 [Ramularia collo-cygni]CZT19459.1 uncharacterized protein RCC_05310 [Ramularia collo-cygni]
MRFLPLAASVAAVQGFAVTLPGAQTPIIDLEIHIHNDHGPGGLLGGMSEGISSDMPSDMSTFEGPSEYAVSGQYDRGLVEFVTPNGNTEVIAGVANNGNALISYWNGTWWPEFYQPYKPYNAGGNFNRSLSMYAINETVYITGVTMSGNLVLKTFRDKVFYPKQISWILLDEVQCVGTPALASHDNKTLSIVARTQSGGAHSQVVRHQHRLAI